MTKPIHAERHERPSYADGYRLTWNCDTDTGQCGVLIMVTPEERDWLIEQDLVYQNADHDDPDHAYSFADDLHPNWEIVHFGAEVLQRLENLRAQRARYPR